MANERLRLVLDPEARADETRAPVSILAPGAIEAGLERNRAEHVCATTEIVGRSEGDESRIGGPANDQRVGDQLRGFGDPILRCTVDRGAGDDVRTLPERFREPLGPVRRRQAVVVGEEQQLGSRALRTDVSGHRRARSVDPDQPRARLRPQDLVDPLLILRAVVDDDDLERRRDRLR